VIKAIATFFGVGFLPLAPGTWASALALGLAWILPGPLAAWLALFCVAGFLVCRPSQKIFASADPKQFVMDEVCGMMLSVLWIPKDVRFFFLAFVFFRALDIWKPWPISRIQESTHASSILWDDLAAGLIANLILQAIIHIHG
jgi:phosphatidylglycerophosphatase A